MLLQATLAFSALHVSSNGTNTHTDSVKILQTKLTMRTTTACIQASTSQKIAFSLTNKLGIYWIVYVAALLQQ